jgi:hypothetical protein
MFKEEKQCWDDALTRGKRQITRQFYEFAQTHPRQGKCDVRIGHLLGRYAAPFNGFTAGSEQTPAYSVWGKFGRNERAWGHLQPEKGNQLMDVLMPGASSHPLRQRYDRRRFFFSGTPYGDFDQVPIEAGERNLSSYKLLMLLCWHTMIPQDYAKLKNYVQNGGTLFLSVPHLTTHADREFLLTMDDPALYNRGDVRELCGVIVKGRGEKFSGNIWTLDPQFKDVPCPQLSRIPSDSPEEDGPCHLADVQLEGARPVIYDAQTRKPLLVEYQLGKGRVFLLTTWAYPGHEMLSESAGSLVSALADMYAGDYRVIDPERETFWTKWAWDETTGVLMALNTGWAQKDKLKFITVKTPIGSFNVGIDVYRIYQFIYTPWGILSPQSDLPYIEKIGMNDSSMQRMTIRIHAAGRHVFHWYTVEESPIINVDGRQVPLEKIADRIYSFEIFNEQRTCCDVIIQRN